MSFEATATSKSLVWDMKNRFNPAHHSYKMSPFAGEHEMEKNEVESRMSLIADYDELIERIKT